jgi:hypothetical protein
MIFDSLLGAAISHIFLQEVLHSNLLAEGINAIYYCEQCDRNCCGRRPRTDVIIFKIFSPKNLAKILALFAQTNAVFCKNLMRTLVFEKNAIFFAENWQKS